MNKKVVLPFETRPYCLCYHNLAFPFGVIQGNGKTSEVDVVSWMLRKFTNCVFDDNMSFNKYEICLCDAWGVIDGLSIHQNINFSKTTFDIFGIDILSFVKKAIDTCFYITGSYNEKFIFGKRAYKKYDFWHDYIIYGYDDENNCFYSAGFMEDGNYKTFKISYDIFLISINEHDMKNIPFNLYKFNKEVSVKFNVIRITKLLKDYTNSTTCEGKRLNGVYGVQANIKLKELFKKNFDINKETKVDTRYTRAFMEHKFFIRLAIVSLCEKKYLSLNQKQMDLVESLYQKAKSIHLLGIKNNIHADYKSSEKIIELFEDIEKIEKDLLPIIVDTLEQNLPDSV